MYVLKFLNRLYSLVIKYFIISKNNYIFLEMLLASSIRSERFVFHRNVRSRYSFLLLRLGLDKGTLKVPLSGLASAAIPLLSGLVSRVYLLMIVFYFLKIDPLNINLIKLALSNTCPQPSRPDSSGITN